MRFALAIALTCFAGCGSSDGGGGVTPDELAAVAGVYAIDLDRTIDAIPASSITPSARAERDARLREVFAASAYALEIEGNGAWRLEVRRGSTTHTLAGTAVATATTVELSVMTLDGSVIPGTHTSVDTLARDGDALVLSDGGRMSYLSRP